MSSHGHNGEEQFPVDIKKTKQREEIFRILTSALEPVSAVDIYSCLLKMMPDAGFAISTVYRSLAVFEEKGYVVKTSLTGSDMSYYEWCQGQHRHYAVCLKCHKLIPLKNCPFEHMKIDAAENFTVTGHRLELYGYCKGCRLEREVP
jgi:Fe2+/Zn2+ uptake regulation proteins